MILLCFVAEICLLLFEKSHSMNNSVDQAVSEITANADHQLSVEDRMSVDTSSIEAEQDSARVVADLTEDTLNPAMERESSAGSIGDGFDQTTRSTSATSSREQSLEPTSNSTTVTPPSSSRGTTTTAEPGSWQIPPVMFQQQQPKKSVGLQPSGKLEKIEVRIMQDIYDVEAWTALLSEVQLKGDVDQIRDAFERFLKIFPTSARHWLQYLEFELRLSNYAAVESLFTRCLKTVLSVDLWKFYLSYIRRINSAEGTGTITAEARKIIEEAYNYVLQNVGMDREAGSVWADYLYFVRTGETQTTWDEQRKMDKMREIYRRALAIPLNNVEHLWKEYDQWENGLNRLTAKKLLAEKSPAYMTARSVLREMRNYAEAMPKTIPRPPTWSKQEVQQLELWKRYLSWERSNPLHLDEPAQLTERIVYAYQQALMQLRFFSEIWYDFAMYWVEIGKPERAITVLKAGIEIMPGSFLLCFMYAELEESRKHFNEARAAFDNVITHLNNEIDKINERTENEVQELLKSAAEEKAREEESVDEIDGEMREMMRAKEKEREKQRQIVEEAGRREIDKVARGGALVWIVYMRFMRRAEGIKAARPIFKKARGFKYCTYHVYVASALMEYYNSKDATVAGKIFELGLKAFGDDPDYICHYLDFLIQLNDDNNTRALFERTLATIPADKARPVWLKFSEYENKYGDLAAIQKVEKRRAEAFPQDSTIERFAQRYSYLDISVIEDVELGARKRTTVDPSLSAQMAEIIAVPNKEREREHGSLRKPLLEAVQPNKYPRPNLEAWTPFKPPAEEIRRIQAQNTLPGAASNGTPQPEPVGHAPPPEAVSFFLSQLPPASGFNGPTFAPLDVIELIRAADLSLAAGAPQPVLPPFSTQPRVTLPPQTEELRGGPPVGSYIGSRGGTRGGYVPKTPRGGPPPRGSGSRGSGIKRKGGRPEFDEDDYHSARGLPPNRPPEYDGFRSRQGKRHRDDPY